MHVSFRLILFFFTNKIYFGFTILYLQIKFDLITCPVRDDDDDDRDCTLDKINKGY